MSPLDWWAGIDAPGFRRAVRHWYRRNGRDLPWRRTSDPYAIWVSEIMLQQTQAATVARRFHDFLRRFPDVASLAAASELQVLRAWEGLGYYRRARMLHKAAATMIREHGGNVPTDPDRLAKLPGFGRYTANAVTTFSTQARLPVLEANTIRLWSRLAALDVSPALAEANQQLWKIAEDSLPRVRCGDFNQALLDIGATVCLPRAPRCEVCPLKRFCNGFKTGDALQFPVRKVRPQTIFQANAAVIIVRRNHCLLVRRSDDAQWGGLWEFPRVAVETGESPLDAARRAIKLHTTALTRIRGPIGTINHSIMHFRIQLTGFFAEVLGAKAEIRHRSSRWVKITELGNFPLSRPQRRLAGMFFLDCSNSSPK